jgi:hypothetical protein
MGFDLPDYYRRVSRSASGQDRKAYHRDLRRSLSLDTHVSREDVLQAVGRLVVWKRMREYFRLPYRLAVRLKQRIERKAAGILSASEK